MFEIDPHAWDNPEGRRVVGWMAAISAALAVVIFLTT